MKHWTLYARDPDAGGWRLEQIIPVSATRIDAAPGTYAVCACDRLMQESIGVLVEVAEPAPSPEDDAKAEDPALAEADEDTETGT